MKIFVTFLSNLFLVFRVTSFQMFSVLYRRLTLRRSLLDVGREAGKRG